MFLRRHRFNFCVGFLALAIGAIPVIASASHAIIDFESLPLGTSPVNTQFQSDGVVFSSPGNPAQPEINNFSTNSTTGNVLADFSIIGGIQLDATFSPPAILVESLVYANPSYQVTMRAYDASDTLIGTAVSPAGATYNQGTLGLNGIGPISRVSWTTGSDIAAVGIDNLAFQVPEPATATLAMFGLVLVAKYGRRI